MTLEQLRIFLCVAEELNMTRAAEKLHFTQPAISAAIAALEERYATRLFDRVGRRIELTEAGRLFQPEARAVMAQVSAARHVLDDLAGLERGEIRIAASQTVATYWLPSRMARFAAAQPRIQLRLEVGNTTQTAARLLQGDADIAFVEGEISDPLLSNSVIGGDRIALYCGPGHPLAGRTSITAAELAAVTWVMREPGSGTRDHAAAGLLGSGIDVATLRIALELPSNGAVLEATEGGTLVAAVSELAATSRLQAGMIRPLPWPLPDRHFTMLRHRSRRLSRAVEAFVSAL